MLRFLRPDVLVTLTEDAALAEVLEEWGGELRAAE
jgi:hypothetical protein